MVVFHSSVRNEIELRTGINREGKGLYELRRLRKTRLFFSAVSLRLSIVYDILSEKYSRRCEHDCCALDAQIPHSSAVTKKMLHLHQERADIGDCF